MLHNKNSFNRSIYFVLFALWSEQSAATCNRDVCAQVRMSERIQSRTTPWPGRQWASVCRSMYCHSPGCWQSNGKILHVMLSGLSVLRKKRSHWHQNANATVFSRLILVPRPTGGALQTRSSSVFWLMHWEAKGFCVCIPPSQVSPVTGLLHEYKLLHLQQQAKLRTLTGFPNHRTCRIRQS